MARTPPPKAIPEHLYNEFTCRGVISVEYGYTDESFFADTPAVYERETVDQYMRFANERRVNYYGATDQYLYHALEKFPICGQEVAIMGSTTPWYESIALSFGALPTSIDYNKIDSRDARIRSLSVEEYRQNPVQFDALISISSFEHDGLGRYGDPLCPNGDLSAMTQAKQMVREGGYLFLAVPVGKDLIVFNRHRVYGRVRLPMLLRGWEIVGTVGFSSSDLDQYQDGTTHQPLFICRKPISCKEIADASLR